jgi:hypothetical protein
MESWKEWYTTLKESLACRAETEEQWTRWTNAYKTASLNAEDKTSIRVYLIRSLVQTLLPYLYFKNPYVITKPIVYNYPDADRSAEAMEAWINYYISGVLDTKTQARRALLDALIKNRGYIESGWRYKYADIPEDNEQVRLIYDQFVDRPFLVRRSPWDVTYDPLSMNRLEGSRWVGIGEWLQYDQVKDNTAFDSSVRAEVERPDRVFPKREGIRAAINTILYQAKSKLRRGGLFELFETGAEGLLRVWHIYDRKYDRYMLLCPAGKGFLLDEESPYAHLEGFHIKELMFEYDTDEDQPTSLVEQALAQQREMNDLAQRQYDTSKRFSRILEVNSGLLEDPAKDERLLQEGKDGTIIHVTQFGAVKEVEWSNAQFPEWWRLKEACRQDAMFTFGIPPSATSTGHAKFKSATEAALINQAYDVRLDDMREQVADWMEDVVTVLGKNVQEFLEEDKKFMIFGQERDVSPEEIRGQEFEFQVLLSESRPENPDKRLERKMMLYKLSQGNPLMDQTKTLEDVIMALGENNPKYYMMNTGLPGNVPPMGESSGGPSTEGAMAIAGPGAEQMMMGGVGPEIGDVGALLSAMKEAGGK